MSIRSKRRELAIESMADHLLKEGMSGARLRSLAAAAGTSDRMLLYYFADKDELLEATLERLASRLTDVLQEAIPDGTRLTFADLLLAVWQAVRSVELQPYMRLWLELAAGAAQHLQPHRTVAGAIMIGFIDWIAVRLAAKEDSDVQPQSALLLAMVEGALLLDAAGKPDLAELAVTRAASGFG
jgi:AcrR family transcriptional regulator